MQASVQRPPHGPGDLRPLTPITGFLFPVSAFWSRRHRNEAQVPSSSTHGIISQHLERHVRRGSLVAQSIPRELLPLGSADKSSADFIRRDELGESYPISS